MRSFILIILDCVSICCGLQCMIGNGKPVDWFIVYKLPKLTDKAEPFKRGAGYFYMHGQDQNNNQQLQWQRGYKGIDKEDNNPLYWTLKTLYETNYPADLEHMMYNDQPPDSYSHTHYAHSKGVIAFDTNHGFWLIHSLPKYPLQTDGLYDWPDNGYINGQTFLCVTYNRNMLETIKSVLDYMNVFVYDSRKPHRYSQTANFEDLTSIGGTVFRHFAKTDKYNQDLYRCQVANGIGSNLKTVTWRQSNIQQMDESCSNIIYTVSDQDCITFNNNWINVKYSTTKEHSKWAVGNHKHVTCVGDINREDSQKKRGGGTACIENYDIWGQFSKLVNPVINPVQPPANAG